MSKLTLELMEPFRAANSDNRVLPMEKPVPETDAAIIKGPSEGRHSSLATFATDLTTCLAT